jgi:hypothetical protein
MAAITYTSTFTDGAVNLSTGATWAADGDILIPDQTQTIAAGLDVSTNAIDALHVIGGSPRIVDASGGGAKIKPDHTFTTYPNFIWKAGGYSKITWDTNACTLAVYAGGEHVIAGGTVTTLVVDGATVSIPSGTTITTLILASGRVYTEAAIATVIQSGGRLDAVAARIGATSYTLSGGVGYIENTSGDVCTILNLSASGVFVPQAGSVATLNRYGGQIIGDGATRSLTLGSTAWNNYAGDVMVDSGLVAVGTLVNYVAYAKVGGGAVQL